ncbi:hypothetical protein GX50_04430 [[Emmonsia] crescens]|uniref:Zn(2)-C6 fungal-type domain-containing protein n=1 Tax=[Emmonsia] crescens TaxID=73230 RepID=A0A2B7ZFM5_9EURO|nr:hypothetical protein GX50_04430 [Emmonsia crescens]
MSSTIAIRPSDAKGRKRKAHKKSRQGCGNCKIRRVKCDESRPGCKKCSSFGVSCNYDPGAADLQPSPSSHAQAAGYGSFNLEITRFQNSSPPAPRKSPCSLNRTILNMINTSQANACSPRPGYDHNIHDSIFPQYQYQMREHDLELLTKFQARTVCSIGTDATRPIYRREVIRLAYQHPFLLHMVLTMTLMHDRYLSDPPLWPRSSSTPQSLISSPKALLHWYLGTTLFNTKLSNPSQIHPEERDAIWATSVLLCAITFSYVEASRAEDSWPLKPPSHLDLDWLTISDGKREVWKLSEPLRTDSVFREALVGHAYGEGHVTASDIGTVGDHGLNAGSRFCFASDYDYYSLIGSVSGSGPNGSPPDEFLLLHHYITTTFPDPNLNPYYTALTTLHNLFTAPLKPDTPFAPFLAFITHIDPVYSSLLHHKDQLALLLLAYWYGYIYKSESEQGPWWLWSRVRVEGRALCMYLERSGAGIGVELELSTRNVIGGGIEGMVDERTVKQLISWPKRMCGLL